MLSLHVPLIRGGIDFDLAQFTLNFDNLELRYWSRTPQCSFSGCHSVTVYGLGANSISLIYFSLLLLPLKKHALERKNCIFYPTGELVKSNDRFVICPPYKSPNPALDNSTRKNYFNVSFMMSQICPA